MKVLQQVFKFALILFGLLLLAQCDQKEQDSERDFGGDGGKQRGVATSSRSSSDVLPITEGMGSGSADGGTGVSSGAVPTPEPGEAKPIGPEFGSLEWQEEMDGLKQKMKNAIAAEDLKALSKSFQSAFKLQGASISSSMLVFSELVPDLSGNLQFAKDFVDSMDREKMAPGPAAVELALSIKNNEERIRWVESLADPELREIIRQALGQN